MNCNGQPITPRTAEAIEQVNKYINANKAYFEAWLAWWSLWMPYTQYYRNITKGESNDNKGS